MPDSAGLAPDNIEDISENEKKIIEFINTNSKISTIQVMEIAGVKERRAREILRNLLNKNLIIRRGKGRNTHYILNKGIL